MDADVIVIGAGPNGLFAAARLASNGLDVLVVEANDRPGGALWDVPATKPGFVHDVGAAFVAFTDSVAFRSLPLEHFGLKFAWAPIDSAHPALDGTCPVVSRDLSRSMGTFGSAADDRAFVELAEWHRGVEPHILEFLRPLPRLMPALRMGPRAALKLGGIFASSGAGFSRRTFRGEVARRVIPSMGLHVDAGPEDDFAAALSYVLALRATTAGFAVPVGGAGAVSRALVAFLESCGSNLMTWSRVASVLVRGRRAVGVQLEDGQTLSARAVVADVAAPHLYLNLLDAAFVPSFVRRQMQVFPMGWGTFKVDFALSGPVPWATEACHQAAVVHAGESLADLQRFTLQVRKGELPDTPYLVIGQQSLVDPSRAPKGSHALYVYTHAPSRLDHRYPGGWEAHKEAFTDTIQERIEGLAPGFTERVVARAAQGPSDLEAMSANLIGGDLGGGSNAWTRQLINRPVFPYFRYRTPVRGLYMGSAFTHPGAGIHGMCGWNAAEMVLWDI